MISIIVITYKRIAELKETMNSLLLEEKDFDELILVDNCSMDGTKEYGEQLAKEQSKVRFFSLEKNGGVAAGRNFAAKQAKGDVLVFMDDDAVFEEQGYLPKIVDKFKENEKIGVLAFRVINFYSREMQTKEMPFTDKHINQEQECKTSTYIGAGHAIRKVIFEQCGYYPEDFFYGGEELDLSFRAINMGYEILYYPTVKVLHKQAPSGRVTDEKKWIMTYRNRLITAYSYLPNPYRLISGILWYGKIVVKTKSIRVPNEAVKLFRQKKKELGSKNRVNADALDYLRKNYGRLWY